MPRSVRSSTEDSDAVREATGRRTVAAIVEPGVRAPPSAAISFQGQRLGTVHVGSVAAAEEDPRRITGGVVKGQPIAAGEGQKNLALSRGKSGLPDPRTMLAPGRVEARHGGARPRPAAARLLVAQA